MIGSKVGGGLPQEQGLYHSRFERDACGVGFVADLQRRASNDVLKDALQFLVGLEHRGATGCECETGDGAGVLTSMPHELMASLAQESFGRGDLEPGRYAVGNVFLSKNENNRSKAKEWFERAVATSLSRLRVIGWRRAPVDSSPLGKSSRGVEPCVEQVFLEPSGEIPMDQQTFEGALFVCRKRAEHQITASGHQIYFSSLSSKVICWKGMFTTAQLGQYYCDLQDPRYKTHVAMVHSRFSTNTFPSWDRAHPYRYLCHNGEINTLQGNVNWMRAREGVFTSELLGSQLEECCPIIQTDSSDSAQMDNVMELLVAAGRSLPEAAALMIPGAWQNNPTMSKECHAMYQCQSAVMEPWDGPALVAFTDGDVLGLTLDRNGLRPCRYIETTDGRLIGGSEAGALQVEASKILRRGRLAPGRMLIADMCSSFRIISDDEFKQSLASRCDWPKLLAGQLPSLGLSGLKPMLVRYATEEDVNRRLAGFGYTSEGCEMLLGPMAHGEEGLGSMGNDAAIACMSKLPRSIYDYFHQLFAQVTNPPIDPIREGVVMSLACFIGPEGNLLEEIGPEHMQRLYLENPILDMAEFEELIEAGVQARRPRPASSRHFGRQPNKDTASKRKFRLELIDITYPVEDGLEGLQKAITRICNKASEAIEHGAEIVVLSDRKTSASRVHVSGLLAIAATHAHLVQTRQRLQCGIVLESAEPHEIHHFCVLFGFGCDAVYPYGAYSAIWRLRHDGKISDTMSDVKLVYNYRKSAGKGILKVMSKMGVSCLQSYKGAQIFEALGLADEVIEQCFPNTVSRISGATFAKLGGDVLRLHENAFARENCPREYLGNEGLYHYRNPTQAGGVTESHINDPDAIASLQDAARNDSRVAYQKFSALHTQQVKQGSIRGCLELKNAADVGRKAVPLAEVEPVANILKRFRTGAMSYGSISMEAHATLAVAMNRVGGKSNTGEGGEDPTRYLDESPSGDSRRSSIKQIASGRFGVTIEYIVNSDELQIKMAQGAKPGEGGELPGHKVDEQIAKTRHSTPGVGLISPPPHHDIYSIEDLAQLIFDLHSASDGGSVSVKLVSEAGVGVVAAGVAKAKADHILVSGYDGGTGASRWTGIKHAGLPWELGLAETHQTLVLNGLRGRVTLETDGNLRNGRDIVMAAFLGAEHFGLATAPLIAMGCIMMRKCHLNTCPVGIATQDPELRKKFTGQPEHVINYLTLVAEEVRVILASLGFRSLDEAVGHAECLACKGSEQSSIDLSRLLVNATQLPDAGKIGNADSHGIYQQDHGISDVLDRKLLRLCEPSLSTYGVRTEVDKLKVTNVDRTVGAIVSNRITKAFYPKLLAENTIHFKFLGCAGQSFGAFACTGMTLEVEGEANDYVGKGLSGGVLAVFPPAPLVPHENVIAGNVCLYGATSGRAFLAGVVAERFCVRNSGAKAVVEGVGDHGCEYMTGGCAVILGSVGTNFGAGMSGGVAYIWDPDSQLHQRCNHEMVDLQKLVAWYPGDTEVLKGLIEEHLDRTGSVRAREILSAWGASLTQFTKVMPRDLKKVMDARAANAEKVPERTFVKKVAAGPLVKDLEDFVSAVVKPKRKKHQGVQIQVASSDGSTDTGSDGTRSPAEDLDVAVKTRDTRAERADKNRGFIAYERADIKYRDAPNRMTDFMEITDVERDEVELKTQAARCMDCGVPFCHQSTSGCPLGNLIPEWNDLAHKGKWKEALERLLATNNFPEFTGRVCPAPCEGACVLGIIDKPVGIKSIEVSIIDKAWEMNLMVPRPPSSRSGMRVAIVGSGPSGLAAADQLNRVYGHQVTVFERADRVGGLMMYGVPNMKADKRQVVERRVELMVREGVEFRTNANIGGAPWLAGMAGPLGSAPTPEGLMAQYDAILLSTGATAARNLNIPGRGLRGVHLAMEFLHENTKALLDAGSTSSHWRARFEDNPPSSSWINVEGKAVVVIGGGDTGNDCIGTAIRQGATSVVNFEIMPQPGDERDQSSNPWPQWPRVYRVDYGHKEVKARDGKDPREYLINAKEFVGKTGQLEGVRTVRVEWVKDANGRMGPREVPGSEEVWPCNFCFLAMGFLGPEPTPAEALGVTLDARSNYKADYGNHRTNVSNVFAAGDCRRGQSLVVWAISEGRHAAKSIDSYLMEKSKEASRRQALSPA